MNQGHYNLCTDGINADDVDETVQLQPSNEMLSVANSAGTLPNVDINDVTQEDTESTGCALVLFYQIGTILTVSDVGGIEHWQCVADSLYVKFLYYRSHDLSVL